MCFLYTLVHSSIKRWFADFEYSARFQWIQSHDVFRKLDDSVANLTIYVASDREDTRTREHLKLLTSVASCLGLPTAEMDRIVESVSQFGQESQTKVL